MDFGFFLCGFDWDPPGLGDGDLDSGMTIFSVGYDSQHMKLDGKFAYLKENQRTLSFNVDIARLPRHKTVFTGSSSEMTSNCITDFCFQIEFAGNYSVYGFEVRISRSLGPYILSVYLPSAMFVMMSWVSFFVPPVCFALTTIKVLINENETHMSRAMSILPNNTE